MTSRERVIRSLSFTKPDRPPLDHSITVQALRYRPDDVNQLRNRFPSDFIAALNPLGSSPYQKGTPYTKGCYWDTWGCCFECGEDGVQGEVRHPPLDTWDKVDAYRLPWEMVDHARVESIHTMYNRTDRFMMGWSGVMPFLRYMYLRGMEQTMLDIAYEDSGFFELLNRIHDFHLRELEIWCTTAVDGIHFSDEWGSKQGMLIAPEQWRRIFKPLYANYCDRIKQAGKWVFFHSDGNIQSIMSDLVEIGVDAFNGQVNLWDPAFVSNQLAGSITLYGELDRQQVLPFGSPDMVHQQVVWLRRLVECSDGGMIGMCSMGLMEPLENLFAAYESWEVPFDALPSSD
jgi:uroporphyrinogen decarboxylase